MRDPDFQHDNRRAWTVHVEPKTKAQEAALGTYLINYPGAHLLWSYWSLGVIHLRDIEGVSPANKRYDEAEYEFTIFSIDPERCPEPDPDAPPWPILTPYDVVVQFHGVDDDGAARIAELSVKTIVKHGVSPDQDWRTWWKTAIWNAVEHVTTGHPEGSA